MPISPLSPVFVTYEVKDSGLLFKRQEKIFVSDYLGLSEVINVVKNRYPNYSSFQHKGQKIINPSILNSKTF